MVTYELGINSQTAIPLHFDLMEVGDAAIVNSWWDTNTKLLFFITSNSVTEIHSVMIMNTETPFAQYVNPFDDKMKGQVELEGY